MPDEDSSKSQEQSADTAFTNHQQLELNDRIEEAIKKTTGRWLKILGFIGSSLAILLAFFSVSEWSKLKATLSETALSSAAAKIDQAARDAQAQFTRTADETLKRFAEDVKRAAEANTAENAHQRRLLEDNSRAVFTRVGELSAHVDVKKGEIDSNYRKLSSAISELDQRKAEFEFYLLGVGKQRAELDALLHEARESKSIWNVEIENLDAQLKAMSRLAGEKIREANLLFSELRPIVEGLGALKPHLNDAHVAQVFGALRQDYSRLKTFEVRVIYEFPSESKNRATHILFDVLWLEGGVDANDLQLYSEENKTTTLATDETFSIIKKYQLFAPFEMKVLGQDISFLNKLSSARLNFEYKKERFVGSAPEKIRAYLEKLCAITNEVRSAIRAVEIQVLTNGNAVFNFRREIRSETDRWPELKITNLNLDTEFACNLSLDISESFKDAHEYYWAHVGKPRRIQEVGPASPTSTSQSLTNN